MGEEALQYCRNSDIPIRFLQVAIMCDAASRGKSWMSAKTMLQVEDGNAMLNHQAMNFGAELL